MNKCTVTIKKDFSLHGDQYYAGTTVQWIPGANIEHSLFDQLLEVGAIELGINEEFMKQKGSENASKNLADRKDSD